MEKKYGLQLTNNSKASWALSLPRSATCIGATEICKKVCYGNGVRYRTNGQKARRERNLRTIELLLEKGGPELLAENLAALVDTVRPSDWLAASITGVQIGTKTTPGCELPQKQLYIPRDACRTPYSGGRDLLWRGLSQSASGVEQIKKRLALSSTHLRVVLHLLRTPDTIRIFCARKTRTCLKASILLCGIISSAMHLDRSSSGNLFVFNEQVAGRGSSASTGTQMAAPFGTRCSSAKQQHSSFPIPNLQIYGFVVLSQ